jgi:hypothetical protein
MAEIKNNFTGSKMNQDIDDRLMPNNEYRYALNLEINKSQNSDVGALQNVFGNSLVLNFNTLSGASGLECIGTQVDESNDNIFIFLTNYNGSTYSSAAGNFIYVYNNKQNTYKKLVSGAFLNFSMSSPIFGINILENLLFWTDNRNQPRRINIDKASNFNNYYTNEEQISVAKISPYEPIELYKVSPLSTGNFETTLYDVVSEYLPDGVTANPYYDADYVGDPSYLSDKYVRFSYRFKFEDGEDSIMAPFTQIAYIPKQDGYFMYKPHELGMPGDEPEKDDEANAYRSTIVEFMQNKVNKILLQIKLPCAANLMLSLYKISEIEILYKDATLLSVSVVDSIPTNPSLNSAFNNSSLIYSYEYQSKKPFKTLSEKEVIRVYDRTPVKALCQEVVSNRIVYSNYQDKFTYPKYLDYNVGHSTKLPFGTEDGEGTSIIEYPNHSVKENRNYQVGIVLCDKFGRQSGVILSDKADTLFPGVFGASSLYVPYIKNNEVTPSQWPGGSLKILFNEPISPDNPNSTTGWPGLYRGDSSLSDYNPLGWYSYKVVVKQTEQDYYNVYLPGTMAAYPTDLAPNFTELGKTSHVVLINDNINKVPRDLTEVGPSQLQFRSSVVLYPRVNNSVEAYGNEQYYPGNTYAFASTIATNNSLFFSNLEAFPDPLPPGFSKFYQIDSNPLIARLSTPAKLGILNTQEVVNLSVYETKAVESKLDIYWETSSAGLISELNTAIQSGSTSSVEHMNGWNFNLSEAASPGDAVTTPLSFEDIIGSEITPTSVVLVSANTLGNVSVLDKFTLANIPSTNTYSLKTAAGKYFYYGFNASTVESYVFTIKATVGFPPVFKEFVVGGSLSNVAPAITNKPTATVQVAQAVVDAYDFNGNNGSNPSGGNSTSDLSWSVSGSSLFTITNTGILQNLNGLAEGTFNLTVVLTEASGSIDSTLITVNYPIRKSVTFSSGYIVETNSAQTTTYNGTVTVYGQPASFNAFAEIQSTQNSSLVDTDMVINGTAKGAEVSGTTPVRAESTLVTLQPSVTPYSYSVTVRTTVSGGFANLRGGIEVTQ